MKEYTVDPAFVISDEPALRSLFEATHTLAALKSQDALDTHAQAFIRRSPFVCIGTQGLDGKADVSPRGDPVGFVRILDEHTLAIPDRPGNNRLDSLANIVANPNVGLLFIIPGFDDTLRVNGIAEIRDDEDLRARFDVKGRLPATVMLIHVRQAYLHCAKAFMRSKLWDPDARVDRKRLPSLGQMIKDQISGDITISSDEELAEIYRHTLY